MLDANLQLATALQDFSPSSKLHIPAGVEAYWVAAKAGHSSVWATATAKPARMSDHTIFTDGSGVLHLAGLEVKPAGARKAVPASASASESKPASNVMYEVCWGATGGATAGMMDRHGY